MAGKTNPQFGKFGSLGQDSNRYPMGFASSVKTTDGAASPLASPQNVSNLSATTLTVPANAVQITITPVGDLRVSEVSNLASYTLIKAGTTLTLPVVRLTNLYLQGDSAAGNVYFAFSIV